MRSACSDCSGMPVWQVREAHVDYRLFDAPLRYTPAYGPPISLDLVYQTWRPTDFGYYPRNNANPLFGPQWHCEWSSDLVIDTKVYWNYLGGRIIYIFNTDPLMSETHYDDGSRVEIILDGGSNVIGGKIHKRDGTVLEYSQAYSATQFLLTSVTDSNGKSLTFSYDGYGRLEEITAATGETASFTYGDLDGDMDSSNDRVVTQINAPGGYTAAFAYEYHDDWYLTNITDTVGITSTFTYREDTMVVNYSPITYWSLETLNTPYGTTQFEYLGSPVDLYGGYASVVMTGYGTTLLITEPNGGQHLYVSSDHAPNPAPVPASFDSAVIPSGLPLGTLDTNRPDRNTFYWGPLQLASIGNVDIESWDWDEFKRARIRHWLTLIDQWDASHDHISDTLSWEQSPSPDGTIEGQVTFYDYAGKDPDQPNFIGTGTVMPAVTARVLPDGTTWYEFYEHNALGTPTKQVETYTKPDGSIGTRTNIFEYAANGIDMTRHVGPQAEQVVSNYFGNAYHQVDASYDALNQETRYTYNANRQLTSIHRPTDLTTTNIYYSAGNAAHRLEQTIDLEINRENSYTYYDNGLVYSHTDERGLTTTNYWDNLQRLTGTKYPDGTTVSNIYTALDITAAKDRLGYWTYAGYNSIRQKNAETNALGHITKYGYCDCGSLDTITNALGQITTFGYDNAGRRTTITYPDSSVKSFRYDKMGRLTNEQNSLGIVGYIYNNQSLIVSVTNAAGLVAGYGYDIEDQAIYVTNSSGVKVTQDFDALGRVVKRTYPDTGYELFEYSNRGLITHTNGVGKITRFTYDQSGNKLSEQTPNSEYIYFTNSAAGDLISLRDGKSQVTIWSNDIFGRVISKKLDGGAVILTNKYDANGQLIDRWSVTKSNTLYTYDAVGNLTNINYPVSTDIQFSYDALNRVTNMVDAAGTNKYTYHSTGGLLTEDGPWVNDTVTYDYNGSLLRSSMTVQQPPGGDWLHAYTYDASSRLTYFATEEGDYTYTYRGAGNQVTNIALPNTSHITNGYDSVGRLINTSLKHSGGTVLNSHGYVHNYAGQRTRQNRTDGSYVLYTYDNNGQLKSGWGYTSSDVVINSERRGYVFDAAWNMTKKTNDASETTFTVNNLNQATAVSATGITYDGNGNRITRGTTYTYGWDDENQLLKIELTGGAKAEFVYDGRQRRKIRKEYYWNVASWTLQSETRYIYDGMRVIEERDGSNNALVRYTRGLDLSGSLEGAGGIGGLLARTPSGTATYAYYHADGGGNITAMVDSGQNLVANYRYDPFGSTISSSGTLSAANLYRFSSKEVHGTYSFYYYGYRYYDPIILRWLNRDPIGEMMGGINLYGYVENNPVNFFDPFGHGAETDLTVAIASGSAESIDIVIFAYEGVLSAAQVARATAAIQRLKTPVCNLIRGSLKRSKSYHSELENLTYEELLKQGTRAAAQMKKLILSSKRLME